MENIIQSLYDIAKYRKQTPQEGSYTCYLFEQGLDKILKKCGEECSEVIISAKNKDNSETCEEICDLIYHLIVLMVNENIDVKDIQNILCERSKTAGNLKKFHNSNKLS